MIKKKGQKIEQRGNLKFRSKVKRIGKKLMQDDNYPCVCKFQHTVQDLLTELNNTHQISAGILDKHKQY